MATSLTVNHIANILIKMEGEGDWVAKKEKINGKETIVFFKKEKASSPLQVIRDKLDNIMSGTTAANKYLKKMHINEDHSILRDMRDTNKKRMTKDSLNSYIHNLYSMTKENGQLSRSIQKKSHIEVIEDNFLYIHETISFAESKDSSKSLDLINSLIGNNCGNDIFNNGDSDILKSAKKIGNNDGRDILEATKTNIVKYTNLAFDNSYLNKSIKEQNEHKKQCNEAYTFLQNLELPESSPEQKELDKLINKLKVIANTKPSTNPTILKMKQEIASDFLGEISDDLLKNHKTYLSENEIKEIIKFIDIAIDPNSYKSKGTGSKEFIKLCAEARINLINLSKTLDQPSHSQKNIYKLIENLDLVIPGVKTNTATWEIKISVEQLTKFLKGQLKDKSDTKLIERINSSVKTAFYNFYDIEMEGNSKDSAKDTLQRLGDANQTLHFLRELARPDASTNVIANEAVATLDKLIENLNNKIDKLKLER
jgi:hypothetical protein